MSDPSNDVSPTIQEPQRVPENTDSDTQVVDEELKELLDDYAHAYQGYDESDGKPKFTIQMNEAKAKLQQLLGQQLVKELEYIKTNVADGQTVHPLAPHHDNLILKVDAMNDRIEEIKQEYNLNPKERSE